VTKTSVVVTTSDARAPTRRPKKAGEDCPQQRQKEDGLVHARYFTSSIAKKNRVSAKVTLQNP
jgi:hypothetical protein